MAPLVIFRTAVAIVAAAAGPTGEIAGLPMSWSVDRQIEADSGLRRCRIVSHGGDVSVIFSQRSGSEDPAWSVVIGFDNQPGSIRYLRINRSYHQNAEASFRGAQAKRIVEALKRPGEFVFEWVQKPKATKRGGLFANGDFAAKAAECEDWAAGSGA